MSQLTRTLKSVVTEPEAHHSVKTKVRRNIKASFRKVLEMQAARKDLDEAKLWAIATHIQMNPSLTTHFEAMVIQNDTEVGGSGRSGSQSSRSPSFQAHAEKGSFTFIDLFAGIGGFHLALSSAGGRCVFASEWDNSARRTYAMNHGLVPFGDIRDFTRTNFSPKDNAEVSSLIPYADVVAAGFPCQPFSQAGVSSRNFHGKEHGLKCEAQGTLFEDILIIARAIKPKVLLLENVSNLARHDGGNTLRVITSEIELAGYTLFPRRRENDGSKWATIDSQSVVAQRRKRVYFVAVRNDLVESIGEFNFPEFSPPTIPFALEDVLKLDDELTEQEKLEKYSISPRLWASHQVRQNRHIAANNGFRIGLVEDLSKPAPTLVARYYKDGKDCLIPNRIDPSRPPRMLTPRECALLQTYPQDFWIPESRTPAYKQFGNSITVEIARRVARAIKVQYLSD